MNATVSQYDVFTSRLTASSLPANPFQLLCMVLVTGPQSSRHPRMNITMFYDGGNEYAWRLAPDVVGEWHWTTTCAPGFGLDGLHGTVRSTAARPGRRGGVIADPSEPLQMVFENGEQYTLVGIETDWLWAQGLLHGAAAMEAVVDGLDALGINRKSPVPRERRRLVAHANGVLVPRERRHAATAPSRAVRPVRHRRRARSDLCQPDQGLAAASARAASRLTHAHNAVGRFLPTETRPRLLCVVTPPTDCLAGACMRAPPLLMTLITRLAHPLSPILTHPPHAHPQGPRRTDALAHHLLRSPMHSRPSAALAHPLLPIPL
jgi:hypothetical protein